MKEESILDMIEKEAEEYVREKIKNSHAFTIKESINIWEVRIYKAYIAGRSKSIESFAEKDERIKELKEALSKAIEVIKQWHNADEVWDIYFNNAPEMKSIRELLNNK